MKINNWILEVNTEETKKQYLKEWDLCDCLYCHNFYQATKSLAEAELQFFKQFGINPSKCNHISHFDSQENGLHLYIGCYHIVGKVSAETITIDGAIKIGNSLTACFSNDLEFVPDGFTKPVLQIDFELELPWVL